MSREKLACAIKIAGLSDDAKAAAVETGLDDNQSALLKAAHAPNPADELRRLRAEKNAEERISVIPRPHPGCGLYWFCRKCDDVCRWFQEVCEGLSQDDRTVQLVGRSLNAAIFP